MSSHRCFVNPYVESSDQTQPLTISSDTCLQLAIQNLQMCFTHVLPSQQSFDGGLYTGYQGIAWATLWVLRNEQLPSNVCETFLQNVKKGIEEINRFSQHGCVNREDQLSMLLGLPGNWIIAAMFYHRCNQIELRDRTLAAYASLSSSFLAETIFRQGSDEIFIGRAGYLIGIAVLRSYTNQQVLSDENIYPICDAIINSGMKYAHTHHSLCPLMYAYHGTEYLGAGHGLVGILFALMLFPDYSKFNPSAERLVQQSLNYLIQITPQAFPNLPAATDELSIHAQRPPLEALVHWCHGATGAFFAFARAYVIWNDARYLNECRRCADVVWQYGLLKKGPGICHGVAGNGYIFLVLYRLTGEAVYLHRAASFAKFMVTDTFKHARRPDSPFSLFEGLAGTACFYADFATPSKAAFPLMDPLWDRTTTTSV